MAGLTFSPQTTQPFYPFKLPKFNFVHNLGRYNSNPSLLLYGPCHTNSHKLPFCVSENLSPVVSELQNGTNSHFQSDIHSSGEKKFHEGLLFFERGPQGKVHLLKKMTDLQVAGLGSVEERIKPNSGKEMTLEEESEAGKFNNSIIEQVENISVLEPAVLKSSELQSSIPKKIVPNDYIPETFVETSEGPNFEENKMKKKSRIVIGRKSVLAKGNKKDGEENEQEQEEGEEEGGEEQEEGREEGGGGGGEKGEGGGDFTPPPKKVVGKRVVTKVTKVQKEVDEKVKQFMTLLWEAEDETEVDRVLKDAETHIGSGRRAWRQALRTLLMTDKWKPRSQESVPEIDQAVQAVTAETVQKSTTNDAQEKTTEFEYYEAEILLSDSPEDPATDANTVITRALEEADLEKARRNLEVSIQRGIRPSQYVVSQTLSALGRNHLIKPAEDLFELLIRSGYKSNRVLYNCMIAAYGEVGDFGNMEKALERMRSVGVSPNIVTYNTLVRKYLKGERMELAMTMLNEMRANGYIPNVRSYNTVLASLRDRGQVEQAEDLLREMKNEGCLPSLVTYNIVLTGYADAGRVLDVERLFSEILNSGFEPNNITIGTCMAAFRNFGNIGKVEEYYSLLSRFHLSPDVITLSILASAYGKVNKLTEQTRVQRQIDVLNGRFPQRKLRWVAGDSLESSIGTIEV